MCVGGRRQATRNCRTLSGGAERRPLRLQRDDRVRLVCALRVARLARAAHLRSHALRRVLRLQHHLRVARAAGDRRLSYLSRRVARLRRDDRLNLVRLLVHLVDARNTAAGSANNFDG